MSTNIIVFNATKRGASHVKKGTVCQDYSLCYNSPDGSMQVAIVCDGHGGDTYVRSDVGSRLAAEIALANIQNFVASTPASLFLGKKGAVTSHPKDEEAAQIAPEKTLAEMTEVERQRYEQDQQFLQQVADLREQDQQLTLLFGRIYIQWLQAIEQHANEHPFNDHEQTLLGSIYQKWMQDQQNGISGMGTRIVKAYGSTLMAFIRTPLYWLAFHIGDGKLMACDAALQWFEPVPWDCRCFLNVTTSLCDSSPIGEFRYAFNGMGDFPVAVILGSDGLDDSWGNFERLANFYSQTLGIFLELGKEKAVSDLEDYLPKLSAKASQDDMSMAGIIDLNLLAPGIEAYRKERELRELSGERQKRAAELEKVKLKVKEQEEKVAKLNEEKEKAEKEKWNILNLLKKQDISIEEMEKQLTEATSLRDQAQKSLNMENEAFNTWVAEKQQVYMTIKAEVDDIKKKALEEGQSVKSDWQQLSDQYKADERSRKIEAMQQRSQNMEAYSEEALVALDKEPMEQEEREESTEQNEPA
jgi:serine/threonine protein phosphatase PrpC